MGQANTLLPLDQLRAAPLSASLHRYHSYSMTLKRRIAMLFRRFTPLEEKLLSAVRGVLPRGAVDAFDAQVAAINRVQRLPRWTEIDFYSMRGGKVDWSHVALFARTTEFPLAEVRFHAGGRPYKARLTAVDGHIFDFAIVPGGRDVAFLDWEGEAHAVLLENPLDAGAQRPAEPLPEAWIEFLRAAECADQGGWILHELGAEYRIALDDGEFLVLGERAGEEFLLYRLDPLPGEFFIQFGHDCRPTSLQGGLGEWLASQSNSAA